jgi:hypothetical protein
MNTLGTGRPHVEARPSPGDAAVCINCGGVMMLDDQLRPRGMSDEEMDELAADREFMDQIARIVRKVHFLKHVRG